MPKRKSIRHRRSKKEALDLDINSLLDILVILLVFLLKSYNASDLTVTPKENIKLPGSESKTLGEYAVIVQVSQSGKIWVNNDLVGVGDSFIRRNIASDDGKIISLFNRLMDQEKEELTKKTSRKKVSETKMINLVFDKNLEYARIKKVMHTAGLAGFNKFKFIVMSLE